MIKPVVPSSLLGATYHFMASKDDDNRPISSPIPGPLPQETPLVSVQPLTPLVHPPPSPTISVVISPSSTAGPSIPLPRSQNEGSTRITQQKQQSSWYPSTPHPRRRSLDLNPQGVPSSITPFIPTRILNGSPHTPVDDAGENDNRDASAPWGLANSQVISRRKTVQFRSTSTLPSRHSSLSPSRPYRYDRLDIDDQETQRYSNTPFIPPLSYYPGRSSSYRYERPDIDDQETQRYSNTPFIPPHSSPSGSSSVISNDRAGVSADYHNSGWDSGLPPLNYPAPEPLFNTSNRFQSFVREATPNYGGGVPPSAPWTPAGYPMLRPRASYPDGMAPGEALRYNGVRNAGAALEMGTPWVAIATMTSRGDEAATPTHPVTNPTSTHSTTNPTSMRPTTTSTSILPVANPSWAMHVYSQTLQITGERLRRYQIVRSKLRFESQLNDLFSGSLGLWLRFFSFGETTVPTVHS